MERERERVQFPFPFPFLSFRSRVRYYRSGVRYLSVPVSVPGVCSFFLEQIWNRPVPITVPARSSYRSGSVPGFCSGHLEQTRSCYRYYCSSYHSSYRSWHCSWSIPGPVPDQFHFLFPYFTGPCLGVGPTDGRRLVPVGAMHTRRSMGFTTGLDAP